MDGLLFVALSFVALAGAIYLYIVSFSGLTKLLQPIFGQAAPGIAMLGIPVLFAGAAYFVVVSLKFSPTALHLAALFIALLALGTWAIKNGKLD